MLDSATKHLILAIASYTALTAGGFALVYWACFIARERRRFCPGQRRPKAAWLWPATWVTFPQCGYDLSSLPTSGELCRCPECGRESRPKQRRRSSTAIAYRRTGVLLLLAAFIPHAGLYARSGRWAKLMPDTVLLAARSALGAWTPHPVRRELIDRCRPMAGEKGQDAREIPLWQWQQRWAVGTFIDDLRDDDVTYNAENGMYALAWFPHAMTTPLLEQALSSDDRQLRQHAAHLLRDRSTFTPTDDLLRITVEGLADDNGGGERTSWLLLSNARLSFDYLLEHAAPAEPHLKAGLAAGDGQQRFLCAVIAAATRREALLPAACPILVESLGNDAIAENAKFAAAALIRLGPPARPYLEPVCRDADDQRRQVALLLVERIDEPRAPATRLLPSDAASISDLVSDPSLLKIESMERHFYSFPAIGRARGPQ